MQSGLVMYPIYTFGSEEQKKTYIPKICSGEYAAGSFALTESGAGSDPASMTTSARLEEEAWVLNGSKMFITSAPYAGVFVVWAVTDKAAPKGRGISCFLVEAGTKGLTIGKAEEKMGQHASATHEVSKGGENLSALKLPGLSQDKDGKPRPATGPWSMGAYQAVEAAPAGTAPAAK